MNEVTLPHNSQAEQALLSCLMKHQFKEKDDFLKDHPDCTGIIRCFYHPKTSDNTLILSVIYRLLKAKKPVNLFSIFQGIKNHVTNNQKLSKLSQYLKRLDTIKPIMPIKAYFKEIRNQSLLRRFIVHQLKHVDSLSGRGFELYTVALMKNCNWSHVYATPAVGDGGLDVIGFDRRHRKIGIQCKLYTENVPYKAVQQTNAGCDLYHTQHSYVLTNQFYTHDAISNAKRLPNVDLWNRQDLVNILSSAYQQKINQTKQKMVTSGISENGEHSQKMVNKLLLKITRMKIRDEKEIARVIKADSQSPKSEPMDTASNNEMPIYYQRGNDTFIARAIFSIDKFINGEKKNVLVKTGTKIRKGACSVHAVKLLRKLKNGRYIDESNEDGGRFLQTLYMSPTSSLNIIDKASGNGWDVWKIGSGKYKGRPLNDLRVDLLKSNKK